MFTWQKYRIFLVFAANHAIIFLYSFFAFISFHPRGALRGDFFYQKALAESDFKNCIQL